MELKLGKKATTSRSKSLIFLISAALLWSLGGVLVKLITWNPIAIAGGRSAIASIIIIAYLRKPVIKFSLVQILGALAYAGMVILFILSNKNTTAANAILLQYTAPIYVAILGRWMLNEKASKFDWIIIFSVLCGMVLFFIEDLGSGKILGNLLAVFSGICYAFSVIYMRKQKDGNPIGSVLLGNIIAAVIGLPFMFRSVPNTQSIIGLVLLGVLQLGISYILYSEAIKNVTAIEGIIIPVIEPILNPIWVAIIVGEIPGKLSIIGGLIVLISVTFRCLITTLRPNKKF